MSVICSLLIGECFTGISLDWNIFFSLFVPVMIRFPLLISIKPFDFRISKWCFKVVGEHLISEATFLNE